MANVKVNAPRQDLPKYRANRDKRLRVASLGMPIAAITLPGAAARARKRLKGSVLLYDRPLEPAIAPGEWDANR